MGEFGFLEEISKRCSFQKSLAINKPYEYKGVYFYPVELAYLIEFYICVEVLMIRQERTKDKKLMKLPYLWFLQYAFENSIKYEKAEYGTYIPLLYALLEICTRQNDVKMETERDEEGNFKRCFLYISGVKFDYKDFREIRQIIFNQSGVEYSDEFLNADTERFMREGQLYNQNKSGHMPPSLEDLIDILSMYLKKSTEEIVNNFTIRKFNRIIKYMSTYEEWKLLRGAELGGFTTFKNPIPYWISGFAKTDIFQNENTDYKNNDMFKI